MEYLNNVTNENVTFWKSPTRSSGNGSKSRYDVKVSVAHSEGQKERITITFGANTHKLLTPYTRAKVSDFNMVPDKIYIGLYGDNHVAGTYALSRSEKQNCPNPKIQYTITDEEKSLFEKHWGKGGYYKLNFDEGLGLYYISSNSKEA